VYEIEAQGVKRRFNDEAEDLLQELQSSFQQQMEQKLRQKREQDAIAPDG
jgi:hypothetical protein